MNPTDAIDLVYDSLEGCEDLLRYLQRHGVESLLVLTQHAPEVAVESALLLKPHITGKRVIEIGAGVGFLALEIARHAKSVVAIESDPAWSWVFTRSLYRHKPANLTWVFGTAQTLIGTLSAEVALIFTNSGIKEMRALGNQFAPMVIMPLQDEVFTSQRFVFDPEKNILAREEEIRGSLHGL